MSYTASNAWPKRGTGRHKHAGQSWQISHSVSRISPLVLSLSSRHSSREVVAIISCPAGPPPPVLVEPAMRKNSFCSPLPQLDFLPVSHYCCPGMSTLIRVFTPVAMDCLEIGCWVSQDALRLPLGTCECD
ncbi:hypothetical protein BaRGS_00021731 [Batillaria attramentaria]|uniref:Uncharacterized protein n=1 Tax=Batillaria attramentaria TaxID=370345 RepID=A0ABD0KIL3_9CAEN